MDVGLAEVWQYRELLYFLAWREVKVRYKQAALGVAWVLVQPIIAVSIFTVIFGMFARLPSDGIPYPLFAFAGVLPWTYFSEALRRSATGLVNDSELVRKIYFPRLIIPVAMASSPVVDFAFAFLVLAAFTLFHGFYPTWNLLLIPVLLLQMMLLALAAGLWLAPINVRYRDVVHTLPFLLQVGMYATPIIYPLSLIPPDWRALYSLNPMVGIVEGFRWALFDRGELHVESLVISLAVSSVVLAGGLVFFRRMERSFADVI